MARHAGPRCWEMKMHSQMNHKLTLVGSSVGSVQCLKRSVPKYCGYWSHHICIWQLWLCVGVQNGLLKTKTKTKSMCKWSYSKIRLWLFPCTKLLHKSLKNRSSHFIFMSKTNADAFYFNTVYCQTYKLLPLKFFLTGVNIV